MTPTPLASDASFAYDLSFIMPCYNEEELIGYTIPRFVSAFAKAGYRLQLVAVDNGSHDRTGEIIKELARQHPDIVPHRVEMNEGYGNGVLQAIPLCTAPWVGIIPADGQVDAEDVVRLYEAANSTNGNVVAKVRRRFRLDGLKRKLFSTAYNLFVRLLWPRLGSIDVNGSPKLLLRSALQAMKLESKRWFLDPELLIKAHHMGLRVLEFNVFGRMRGNGMSHIRMGTCWEFLRNLLAYRFTRKISRWKRELDWAPAEKPTPESPIPSNHLSAAAPN